MNLSCNNMCFIVVLRYYFYEGCVFCERDGKCLCVLQIAWDFVLCARWVWFIMLVV